MSDNKIIKLASILGILSILLTTIGITYSFFTYMKEGLSENSVTVGTIKFIYDEKENQVGNGINIDNALPMSDALGKAQTGNGSAFNFKIVSTTLNKMSIPYDITVKKDSSSTLDENLVKVYLAKLDGINEQEVVLRNFSVAEGETEKIGLINYKLNEKLLYSGRVPSNQPNYEQNFVLKMWIDEDADFSPPLDEEGNSTDTSINSEKIFKVRVNVYANGNMLNDEELLNESKVGITKLMINDNIVLPTEIDDKLYEVELPSDTDTASIYIETSTEYQNKKIQKTNENYTEPINLTNINRLSLSSGENYFKIIVTSEDGKSQEEYRLNIFVGNKPKQLMTTIFKENPKESGEEDYTVLDDSSLQNKFGESGLFKATYTENNSTKTSYYFRGEVNNNYLWFAEKLWRIVRINEDGSIRVILQDGIENNKKYMINSEVSVATNMYYRNWSTDPEYAKGALESWYENNIDILIPGSTSKKYSDYISVSTDGGYFCEAPNVAPNGHTSGIADVNMELPANYTSTYQCIAKGGYGKVDTNVGLLTYDEVIMAGGAGGVEDNNFYLKNGYDWWTMSPSGFTGWYATVWRLMNSNIYFNYIGMYTNTIVRPVINLRSDVLITGTGENSIDKRFTVVY